MISTDSDLPILFGTTTIGVAKSLNSTLRRMPSVSSQSNSISTNSLIANGTVYGWHNWDNTPSVSDRQGVICVIIPMPSWNTSP